MLRSHPSPERTAFRPFPQLQSGWEQANACWEHLDDVARRAQIPIYVDRQAEQDLAFYDHYENYICIAPSVCEDQLLCIFALAHELGHAFDPVHTAFPHRYRKAKENRAAEMVAEAAALRALESFDIMIENRDCYLQTCSDPWESWQRVLETRLRARYEAASIYMVNPQTMNRWEFRAQFERARRGTNSEIRKVSFAENMKEGILWSLFGGD